MTDARSGDPLQAFPSPVDSRESVTSTLEAGPLDPLGPNVEWLATARGGQTTYHNNWMNLTHVEYWDGHEGDTGTTGATVSNYMTQVWRRLKFNAGSDFLEAGGPFNGYLIETWNHRRALVTPDALDWGIERFAGLTLRKITKANSHYASSGGVYSHEFGHNYHQTCDMVDGTKIAVGIRLRTEYKRLRGADFTTRTPETGRFAEDFKYFFGADGVAGVDDPNDDANHSADPNVGRQIRWARDVVGLGALVRGAWPVFRWLQDKDIPKFFYIEASDCFKWERKTSWFTSQWEAFLDGVFYRWDGSKWVVYT